MIQRTTLSIVVATIWLLAFFSTPATAASTVWFCSEASCSSQSVIFAGVTHPKTLNCDNRLSFDVSSAGTFAYSVSGCGFTASGSLTVDGTSTYYVTTCPPSGWPCCPTGCGNGDAYKCSQCSSTTTTTTTLATTTVATTSTTTSTSNPTTTTLPTALTAPTLTATTYGPTAYLAWTSVPGATGYTLYYAPYPYTGPDSIGSIPMGTQTSVSAKLWEGASFYVATQAHDIVKSSGYSNIEHFITKSLPVRPATHIDHPSGATADIPAGPTLYSDEVRLNQIDIPDNSPLWDWNNIGWQFDSLGGLTIEGEAVLSLPGSGVSGETVLAYSQSCGCWIELESKAVTLSNGTAGREVRIKNVPTPWVLVVATPTGVPPSSDHVLESAELERLYWTDREEWKRRTWEWLNSAIENLDMTADASSLPLERSLGASYDCADAERDLDTARLYFNASRLGVEAPLPGVGITAFALYLKGLDILKQTRNNFIDNLEEEFCVLADGQYVEQAIETALATYAPWGIDLTRYLLHTKTIGSFDMRVLNPYGEEDFIDAPFLKDWKKLSGLKGEIDNLTRDGTDAEVTCYLRLYSRKAMTDTWVDWLKDWKTQKVVTWMPPVLMASGLVAGPLGPAVFFAAASELIGLVQSNYSQDAPTAYLGCEVASMDVNTAPFVVDVSGLNFSVRWPSASTSLGAGGLGFAQALYGLACLYGVSQTNWYLLQEVRSITAGTRSYCPGGNCGSWWGGNAQIQIPPVLVIAVVQDRPKDHPSDGYPIKRTQIGVWRALGEAKSWEEGKAFKDYHRLFLEDKISCEYNAVGMRVEDLCPNKYSTTKDIYLPIAAYEQDHWPVVINRTEPAAQSIRISIPKSILTQIEDDYDLPENPSPEAYNLVVYAEAQGEDAPAIFQIRNFDGKRAGDDPERVYFTVVIYGKWKDEDATLSGLPPQYDGPRSNLGGRGGTGVLRTHLTIKLRTTGDDENDPRAIAELVFYQDDKFSGEVIVLDPEHEDSERVQHVSVDLAATQTDEDEIADCFKLEFTPKNCQGTLEAPSVKLPLNRVGSQLIVDPNYKWPSAFRYTASGSISKYSVTLSFTRTLEPDYIIQGTYSGLAESDKPGLIYRGSVNYTYYYKGTKSCEANYNLTDVPFSIDLSRCSP